MLSFYSLQRGVLASIVAIMALEYQTFPIQPLVKAHFVINCVVVAITLTVVILRMVSRFIASAKLGWDDYLILLSMPQGIGMLVIQGMCKSKIVIPYSEVVAHRTRYANGCRLAHSRDCGQPGDHPQDDGFVRFDLHLRHQHHQDERFVLLPASLCR